MRIEDRSPLETMLQVIYDRIPEKWKRRLLKHLQREKLYFITKVEHLF